MLVEFIFPTNKRYFQDLLNLVLNARLEAMSDLPASSDYLSSISP